MPLRRFARLAGLVLIAALAAPGAWANSAEQLAEEAVAYYLRGQRQSDANERGRLMFLAAQRIRQIRSEFPRHPVTAQLSFGRYNEIDVPALERAAAEWRALNPQAARAAENPGAALVPQFGPIAPANPATPNFGPPAAATPPAPLVPNFSASVASPPAGPPSQPAPPTPNFAQPAVPGGGAIALESHDSRPLPRTEVVERLRRAAVIVYYRNGTNFGHGTGFFISPTHIMTNTHVVEDVDRVVIANKVLGVRAGKVIFRGLNAKNEGIDTAIIELQGQPSSSFLPFAANAQEGETVAVAGYPATPLERDRGAVAFFTLLNENKIPPPDSIPNVRFDFGTMQGVYIDQQRGTENIQMGINVTNGSSGSPIVNQCGQVIAQHYEGSRADIKRSQTGLQVNPARFSYAISFRELLKVLRASSLNYTLAQVPCIE